MTNLETEAGAVGSPATIDKELCIYKNTPKLYISNASIVYDLQQLKNESVIRDFANVTPDTYELIKLTNPTLLLFVDLAKRIMSTEEGV